MALSLYIGASAKQAKHVAEIARALSDVVHVLSDWHKDDIIEGEDLTDQWKCRQAALRDLRQIDHSQVVLFLNGIPSTTGGYHVEFGYAIAKRKLVIIVGRPVNVFQHLDSVMAFPSDVAAIAFIRTLQEVVTLSLADAVFLLADYQRGYGVEPEPHPKRHDRLMNAVMTVARTQGFETWEEVREWAMTRRSSAPE